MNSKRFAKYGLTQELFDIMLKEQMYRCACCFKPFGDKQTYIDHYHHPDYSKLSLEEKRKCIRSITCFKCNRYLIAKNTYMTAILVFNYLRNYEQRQCE